MDKFSEMAKDLKWKCSAFDGLKSTHYQTIFDPLLKIHCQKLQVFTKMGKFSGMAKISSYMEMVII